MKNLIFKEFYLSVPKALFLFALIACMLLIPSYPYAVGILFAFQGIGVAFQIMRENKDMEFTATLPVSRNNIVAVKHITVMGFQLMQLIVAVPIAIISNIINANGNLLCLDANFTFFGFMFITFAIFNTIFLPKFFKTATKVALPIFLAIIACVLFVGLFEFTIAFAEPLKNVLDSLAPQNFIYQIPILIFGIMIYGLTMLLSYKISVKNFEKVSL